MARSISACKCSVRTPTEIGLARYRRLAEHAAKKNVRLALENVEGEAELQYLMDGLRDFDSVGFCLDTGHELCYNRGRDMLAEYGDRLCYLHINSNMGVTSPTGEIGFRDDSHMLPFDGSIDFDRVARQIRESGFSGSLMLECIETNSDRYVGFSPEEYLNRAADAVKKLRTMVDGQ